MVNGSDTGFDSTGEDHPVGLIGRTFPISNPGLVSFFQDVIQVDRKSKSGVRLDKIAADSGTYSMRC